MKIEKISSDNWENAFRGMRHPYESYAKSDSDFGIRDMRYYLSDDDVVVKQDGDLCEYINLGPEDLKLAQGLIAAGTPNDKFLRQINVSMDITAPLFIWKELDTYKVGTTANSTSTMHKLATTPITFDCYEHSDCDENLVVFEGSEETISDVWEYNLTVQEALRNKYLETKDKRYWKELIRLLPESWLQTRTFTCNYAVLRNIVHWRKNHKLKYEWDSFIKACKSLPYADELIFYNNGYDEGYEFHKLLEIEA